MGSNKLGLCATLCYRYDLGSAFVPCKGHLQDTALQRVGVMANQLDLLSRKPLSKAGCG